MKYKAWFVRMRKQNKGVTLVEILIVVAILSIMTGAAGVGISLLYSRDAESCAKTVNTMLESARMTSLAKTGVYSFTLDTENRRCTVEPGIKEEELPSRVTLTLSSEGSYDISVNKNIEIEFDKSTGKVKRLSADGTEVDIKNMNIIRMHAESSNGKKAAVVLVTATGKHFIEYGS